MDRSIAAPRLLTRIRGPVSVPLTSVTHSYWQATRHPWPCLVFVLPLLLTYEVGVVLLDGPRGDQVRNGADAFVRWILQASGLEQFFWAPLLFLAGLLAWNGSRWRDRPPDLAATCSGMAVESVVYALLLWALGKELGPLLHRLGVPLAVPRMPTGYLHLIAFLGAGLYEEALFRLGLLCGLVRMLELLAVPRRYAVAPAALVAALTFAAVHHLGSYGEPFDGFVFLFRTLAGCYFACLFCVRGFGIAVGAHACYDIIVGAAAG